MAWEKIDVGIVSGTLSQEQCESVVDWNGNIPSGCDWVENGSFKSVFQYGGWLIGDSNYGLYCDASDQYYSRIYAYLNGNQSTYRIEMYKGLFNSLNFSIYTYVNEDTQKGTFKVVASNYFYVGSYRSGQFVNGSDIYQIFTHNKIVLYNWQAVPSIVGKSAVSLDLSVILDINDGEAVTTSDASKFDLNNDSNVITLVNNVINQNE